MVFNRNSFFLLVFVLILLPLPLYRLKWLATSKETSGTMYFTGHGNLGSVLGISTYPVIWFRIDHDTIYFNGNVNIPLKEGQSVSVRYQKDNPHDARINDFSSIWGDTLAYMMAPFLIFLVIFFHPDLVPRRSRVILEKKKPWVRILQ